MAGRVKKSLGEMLLESGMINQQQWRMVQEEAKTGKSIRKILADLQIVSEEQMVDLIAERMNIPRIDLNNHLIDPKIIELVPEALARKYQMIPVLKIGNTLTCAMVDVFNILALDEIMRETGFTIEQAIVTEPELTKALAEYYTVKGGMEEIIQNLDDQKLGVQEDEDVALNRLKGMGEEPPVIKLVNMMVMQAVRQNASDIHIEPEEDSLIIRFRIDGILYEQPAPSKRFHSAIISRIKILANLDISERRRPQDGRFQIKMDNEEIDIRVSCVPTVYGENVALRLLNTSQMLMDLSQIGFEHDILERYKKLLRAPNGIILVTGPTGSGKTTTMYASLNALNDRKKNIITIEDPVEYHLAGIRQIQVNPDVDLTFANGLRSILRQDPDIILVGEIRDLETARIAIQASLTGHLVLATLHTNNAPATITRLVDMGIEPYLVASSLIGVVAQRLIRVLCPECSGKKCDSCLKTGYKGRTGLYELMEMSTEIKELINNKASIEAICSTAKNAGMKTLRQDGMEKVQKGITSEEEVLRVTQESQ